MDNETPRGVSDEWSTIPWRKLERYLYRPALSTCAVIELNCHLV
jgi:hypothetical protein